MYNEKYVKDIKRNPNPGTYIYLFLYLFRRLQSGSSNFILRKMYKVICMMKGIEIPIGCSIGGGLYMGHVWGITINANAILGENINIHKGVTIGAENRGARKGAPTIGNNVWIGINSTIVGKITIGDDVLVAPNTYVNCDIPSHSVVFGNPCIVKHKDHATEGYI